MTISLNTLGNVAFDQGNLEKAAPLYTESLTLSQEIGSKKNIAFSLIQLGMIEADLDNYASAHDLISQGLALSKELEHQQFIAYALGCLADVECKEGSYNQAYENYRQSLLLWQELGNQNGVAQVLDGLAHLFTQKKEWERAACLLATADALREAISIARTPAKQTEFEKVYVELSYQLNVDAYSSAIAEGQKMSLEGAISYALEQVPGKA